MGVASLVLGIVSLIIGFVPLCGIIALLPAIIGVILGIIDIVKKNKTGENKSQAIAGLIMSAIAVVVIIFWVGIVGESETQTKETSKTTLTSQNVGTSIISDNKKKKYNIGEIYEDSNIAIKYVSVNDNFTTYNRYATIKTGYKVVKAEFEFENLSSSNQYVSAYEFDCYADGYDCESFWSVDDSGFSSTLSSGKKTKGSVYFEVPKDAKEITIEYSLNVWTSSKVEFIVK